MRFFYKIRRFIRYLLRKKTIYKKVCEKPHKEKTVKSPEHDNNQKINC